MQNWGPSLRWVHQCCCKSFHCPRPSMSASHKALSQSSPPSAESSTDAAHLLERCWTESLRWARQSCWGSRHRPQHQHQSRRLPQAGPCRERRPAEPSPGAGDGAGGPGCAARSCCAPAPPAGAGVHGVSGRHAQGVRQGGQLPVTWHAAEPADIMRDFVAKRVRRPATSISACPQFGDETGQTALQCTMDKCV